MNLFFEIWYYDTLLFFSSLQSLLTTFAGVKTSQELKIFSLEKCIISALCIKMNRLPTPSLSSYLLSYFYLFSEYYFSRENLQKDIFLRRKMDSEGYLPVTLVASFNRVRSLTNDVTFIVDSVQDSTVVEVKDGKFRPIDDPDSWPIAADQPDPVLSPKPEVQVDPTPDPPTSTTNTTTSVAPAVVVASSHDLESAKTTLNPNVPEFVPSFASAQGWFHSFFFKEFQQKKIDIYIF